MNTWRYPFFHLFTLKPLNVLSPLKAIGLDILLNNKQWNNKQPKPPLFMVLTTAHRCKKLFLRPFSTY